ncbi:MAG: hypothetical protein ACN4GZ_17920 [Acidimicrobiales bacterium]
MITGPGETKVDDTGGNNTIVSGDGKHDIKTGDGADLIITGDGESKVESRGGDDRIFAGDGKHDIKASDGGGNRSRSCRGRRIQDRNP